MEIDTLTSPKACHRFRRRGQRAPRALPGRRRRVTAFDQNVWAVGSGLGSSGVESLTLHWKENATCCNAQGSCRKIFVQNTGTYQDQQSGDPGDRVSNGIYGAKGFRPKDVVERLCESGYRSNRSVARLSWWTEAKDFHGNRSQSGWSSIEYD